MVHSYQKPLSGKSVGVVFGSFAPLHQGHLDLIYRAKKENDGGAIVIVCGFDGDKGEPLMPHSKRYRYVREFFADDDLVAVYSINDTEIGALPYPNGWEPWMAEFKRIYEKATILTHRYEEIDLVYEGRVVDKNVHDVMARPERHWYVGDLEYYIALDAIWNEKVTHVERSINPISATMIRNNPFKYWDKIAYPFRRIFSHNILICGTASEGKSTLVTDLGKYFNAPHSWEWPRDYMRDSCVSDWELDGADYLAFLQGQYDLNKKLINSSANNGIFFADTDSMVTRMYAEYYAKDESCALTEAEFEKIAVAADEYTAKSRWDKIFLLAPHGVFVDDHERYMAHSGMKERQELFEILCENIKRSGNWDKVVILDKGYYENFKAIVDYVNNEVIQGV